MGNHCGPYVLFHWPISDAVPALHLPPAAIAYEITSSPILPVHLHKDCVTAEMASQVQGWLRHNNGRPYMCNPCSTLEVIVTGPCAACGLAG